MDRKVKIQNQTFVNVTDNVRKNTSFEMRSILDDTPLLPQTVLTTVHSRRLRKAASFLPSLWLPYCNSDFHF